MHKKVTIIMIALSGGYAATEEFYNKVKALVTCVLPALLPEAVYTCEQLCGPDFWNGLSRADQRLAGRCLVDMVDKEIFPLEFVGCPHANPKKYRLILS